MGVVGQFIRRPQRVWFRRLNFQVHLWIGLIFTLYFVVVGLTGSILVFRSELEALTNSNPWLHARTLSGTAKIETVAENVRNAYPGRRITAIFTPTNDDPVFTADVLGVRGRIVVAADAGSGAVLGELRRHKLWISFVQDLHITLLLGPKGRMINGIGGALLMVLNITGMVIWWPGIRTWKRALTIDFRRTWRRINFDSHRAVGFWTLGIASLWALSAIYFGWPAQVFAFVNKLSPVVSAKPPIVTVDPSERGTRPEIRTLIARAQALDPGTTLAGIEFPYSRRAPLEILMRRGNGIGREYTDTLYFDPWSGQLITIWRYGMNQSAGDWIIWLEVPLHYGTYWGLGIKILWCALGLSMPLLTITGVVLYWNRVLRHKWVHLRNLAAVTGVAASNSTHF